MTTHSDLQHRVAWLEGNGNLLISTDQAMNTMEIQPSADPSATRAKRSRNGCNECRRLHRRCDERKAGCQNCKDVGKSCSYNRTLSWGGRPFSKSPFRVALEGGVGEGEIATGDSSGDSGELIIPSSGLVVCSNARPGKSFVYGQVSNPDSPHRPLLTRDIKRTPSVLFASSLDHVRQPSWSCPSGTPSLLAWVSWLSEHHRLLFDHFSNVTIRIFHDHSVTQFDIRSNLISMAAETNHGFSLLCAILSLSSTHQMNLGLVHDREEIEYWRDMSTGHLRRPGVQE